MIEQLPHTVEEPIAGRAGLISVLRQYLETLRTEPGGPVTPRLTSTGIGVLPDACSRRSPAESSAR
jgi:hypothetical protein